MSNVGLGSKTFTTNREYSSRAIDWHFSRSATTLSFETPGGSHRPPPPARTYYGKCPARARVNNGAPQARQILGLGIDWRPVFQFSVIRNRGFSEVMIHEFSTANSTCSKTIQNHGIDTRICHKSHDDANIPYGYFWYFCLLFYIFQNIELNVHNFLSLFYDHDIYIYLSNCTCSTENVVVW